MMSIRKRFGITASCAALLLSTHAARYAADLMQGLAYRGRAVREPRAVLAEFGMLLPDGRHPADGWSEERLATLVTRDSLIGVAPAGKPSS